MIQRIQTVFLLLAAVMMGLLFIESIGFVKLGEVVSGADTALASSLTDGFYNTFDHTGLIVLAGIGALVPLLAIFLFRNRPLQINLSWISVGVAIILAAASFILFRLDLQHSGIDSSYSIHLGYIFPALAIAFLFLAARYIKKDEELVRSADRLR